MKATPLKNCTFCKYIFFHQQPLADDLFEDANRCEHPVKPVKNRNIDKSFVCSGFEGQTISNLPNEQ